VFFRKESEKESEEKSGEKPSEEKPVGKSSGEKPSEQPQPKPKPKLVRFHCGYCGRDGHKDEFSFKRKREDRMAKEWLTRTSTTLPMVYLSLVCRCPGPRRVLLAELHQSNWCTTNFLSWFWSSSS
jgi:hypothetical protein